MLKRDLKYHWQLAGVESHQLNVNQLWGHDSVDSVNMILGLWRMGWLLMLARIICTSHISGPHWRASGSILKGGPRGPKVSRPLVPLELPCEGTIARSTSVYSLSVPRLNSTNRGCAWGEGIYMSDHFTETKWSRLVRGKTSQIGIGIYMYKGAILWSLAYSLGSLLLSKAGRVPSCYV